MEDEFDLEIEQKEYPRVLKIYLILISSFFIFTNYLFIRSYLQYGPNSFSEIIIEGIQSMGITPRGGISNVIVFITDIVGFTLTITLILLVLYIYICYLVIQRYHNRKHQTIDILNQGSTFKLGSGIRNRLKYRRNGIPFYQPLFLMITFIQTVSVQIQAHIHTTLEGQLTIHSDLTYILVFQAFFSMAIILGIHLGFDDIMFHFRRIAELIDAIIIFVPLIFILALLSDSEPLWILIAYLIPAFTPIILYIQYRTIKQPILVYIDDPESVSFDKYVIRKENTISVAKK